MTTELDRVHERYGSRLDSYGDRQYWRDNHAGQDMGTLLRYVSELEAKVARLQEEAKHLAGSYDLGLELPDGCRCGSVAHPPCSWCTSDANPLNVEETSRG